ncbi:putative 2-dehydropantoate 2-reductase [Stutzerimonas sp. Brlt_13]|uniref:2-dehydropantoate 2-reductase n=1 Tax=Stutzerimonas stutzeri TaxID=316 RepID=A0AA42H7T8_STUST|nr:putative 2-dehydropantoate 2-reductase [Stutzerimonas stutzeri]NMY62512.1 putative 2-dehydropantoate 2-reductase [Pseudomonas sp. WS 5018]HAG21194.1 putative 2-dehydropantoate 2-reductase [Pseudomonas sp.]AEA83950.1 2-dehydropantoate 2-reductase [Stutzerimonas stutzeri DSM 4166]MBS9723118.1 putative 2-dehydropantoate 2-reductase [Stutzerimonas stutzeri]MDH0145800.1 putative 2-dehydropantoate 2-reductase [Stutzerimonas stutzeri]
MSAANPRIGIIGTGAIGGFYGLMLARAGFDVHFLLRSEYDAVLARGLQVNSAVHGPLLLEQPQIYRAAAQMPPCDWLLVGAKSTSNRELAPLIAQVAAPDCKVVVLQNGLGVEDVLRPFLPASVHLLGGLCAICAHRSAPGVVEHQALGGVNLGYHSGPAGHDPQAQQVLLGEMVEMFRRAGVDSSPMPSLAQARWMKLVWNVPFNGLSALLDAGTESLLASDDTRAQIKAIMQEVCAAAQALGCALPEDFPEKLLMGTARMPDYLPSMYHDRLHNRPMELEAIYAAPLAAAAQQGISMPRTEMIYRLLRFLEQRNGA